MSDHDPDEHQCLGSGLNGYQAYRQVAAPLVIPQCQLLARLCLLKASTPHDWYAVHTRHPAMRPAQFMTRRDPRNSDAVYEGKPADGFA